MKNTYSLPFEKLEVWQKSKSLVREVYKVTKLFPVGERFGFVTQMNRSSLSIASNIAEGTSRSSRREQAHFTEIAYGSLMELLCQMIIANELGYITDEQLKGFRIQTDEIAKMINGLKRYQTMG